MSKHVDLSVPLSDEDRAYLITRSREYDVEENDRQFSKGKFAPDAVEEFAPNYTVAAPPIEPGSAADNPPKFVGQRPHGVDRGVWAGSTGQTEQQALFDSPEPHSTPAEPEAVSVEDLSDNDLDLELAARDVAVPAEADRDDKIVLLKEALEAED